METTSNARFTVKLPEHVGAALARSRQPGETVAQQVARLLRLAGVAVAEPVPGRRGRPGAERGPWAMLYACPVGGSVRLLWRGPRDPLTGLPPSNQSPLFNPVRNCERRHGFSFQRVAEDSDGLTLQRLF